MRLPCGDDGGADDHFGIDADRISVHETREDEGLDSVGDRIAGMKDVEVAGSRRYDSIDSMSDLLGSETSSRGERTDWGSDSDEVVDGEVEVLPGVGGGDAGEEIKDDRGAKGVSQDGDIAARCVVGMRGLEMGEFGVELLDNCGGDVLFVCAHVGDDS